MDADPRKNIILTQTEGLMMIEPSEKSKGRPQQKCAGGRRLRFR